MEKKTCGKRERGKNFTEKEKEIAISIIQSGYENWSHFSTFEQKMEPQKKLNGIAANIVFFFT
jgi:hypothetical protein